MRRLPDCARFAPYTLASGELVIPRGRDGHFRVASAVNGHPVEFLVDSGASLVTVSEGFARAAGLHGGIAVRFSTANGELAGYHRPMGDDTANLILEQLRGLRNDVAAFRAETGRRLDDLTVRVGQVEQSLALMRRDAALQAESIAHLAARLDHVDKRLERVERRLDLVGEP